MNELVLVEEGAPQGCIKPELGRLLAAYDWGILSEDEEALFEEHLLRCRACVFELESVWKIGAALRVPSPQKHKTHWLPVGVAAAAAALLIFLEVGMPGPGSRDDGALARDTLRATSPNQSTFTFTLETTPRENFSFQLNVPESS